MAPEFAGAARGQYKKANAAVIEAGYMTINGRNSAPTGVEGLFFALALCERVRLYGYGVEHDPKVPYHYHDQVQAGYWRAKCCRISTDCAITTLQQPMKWHSCQ
eukprot:jgi/Chlat1/8228/Chrsp77S07680